MQQSLPLKNIRRPNGIGRTLLSISKIRYTYKIDEITYQGSAVVGNENREYGLPLHLHRGGKIAIGYNLKNPGENILRSKLKLEEDRIKFPDTILHNLFKP